MASSGGEHRMLFDIRGRRRTAVKVVYAVLAVLMGLSLFLVVGPLNIGQLFGNEGGGSAGKLYEEQIERIETKLKRDPENPDLLVSLTKAHVNAGNAYVVVSPSGGKEFGGETIQQWQEASQAWSEYLKATDEPGAGLAQLMAPTFFTMAEISQGTEIVPNLEAAAEAQEIVAQQRPTLNSLTTLAIYQTYTFNYKQAEETAAKAKKLAPSKGTELAIDKQLRETRKLAKEFQSSLKSYEEQVKKSGGGKSTLENPLNGLGGGFGE